MVLGVGRSLAMTVGVTLSLLCVMRESTRAAWPSDAPNPPPEIDPRLISALPADLDQALAGTPNGLHLLAEAAYSFGTTVSSSGDVYFTEFGNHRIQRFSPLDGSLTTVVTNRPGLYGITTDSQGNIFYAQDSETGTGRIVRRSPAGSEQTIYSGLTRPRQLSTDASGNVYAVLEANRAILKWSSSTGAVQFLVTSPQIPGTSPLEGVAVAADGRIFFSTYSQTGAYGVALQPGAVWARETNGSISQVASGVWRARGLALHPNGKLYLVTEANAWDQGNSGLLVEIDPATKATRKVLAGVDYAQFPAVGPDGRVYVTQARDTKLVAFDPTPGFTSQAIAEPDLELAVENGAWRETIAANAFPIGLHVDSLAVDGFLTFPQAGGDTSLWLRVPAARLPDLSPMPAGASPGPGFFATPTVAVDWRYGGQRAFAVPLRDHVRCRWPMSNVGTIDETPAPDFSEAPEAYLVYVNVNGPGNIAANRWKGEGAWGNPASWSRESVPNASSGDTWVEPLGVWAAKSFPVVTTPGNAVQNLVLGDDDAGVSLQVSGGSLHANGSIMLGTHDDATVNVFNGSLTAAGDVNLSASGGLGDGTINVSGGLLRAGGQMLLGWGGKGGTLNVAAGSVDVGGVLIFNLDGAHSGAREARVNLSGGTLAVGGLSINTLDPARLDIAGGRFIAPLSFLDSVNYWIRSGHITAFNGQRSVNVVRGPGNVIVCTAAMLPTDVVTVTVASGTTPQSQAGYPSFSGTTPLVKSGDGTLVVDRANALAGSTTVQKGTLRVAHASALASSTVIPLAGGTLTLAPGLVTSLGGLNPNAGGVVDVGTGCVTVASGLPVVGMMAALVVGQGDGTWNGTSGIRSNAVAASLGRGIPRTVGWLDNGGGSVTFAYAAPGDTNLDWQIDILDTANVLAGARFDTGASSSWNEGDFTADGVVDILDAAEFVSTALFDAGAYNQPSGIADGGPIAAVPEPPAWPLVAAALAFVHVHRRRAMHRRAPISLTRMH